jgi:hypothetical protein
MSHPYPAAAAPGMGYTCPPPLPGPTVGDPPALELRLAKAAARSRVIVWSWRFVALVRLIGS